MKRTFALCLGVVAVFAIVVSAQDKDGDIDAQIKKAEDAANAELKKDVNAPAAKMPDVKDASDNDDAKAEAKEAAQKKAALDAVVNAKGPATLPPWTPTVPQFTASGPAARKLVDGEPRIVLAGTSPLAPDALADVWDAFKRPNFSHERTGSEIDDSVDLNVTFRNGEDGTEVKMEVERKAGAKLTQVTLSSPIALPQ